MFCGMFKNLIVGVDGRPGGRDAIALATRLLTPGGNITLVNVHSGVPPTPITSTPTAEAEAGEEGRSLLQRERDQAEIAAEVLSFTASSPGRGLHQVAEQRHADLIVVGSCSRGLIGRVMLGDDTKGSLNGAPCAVAVATRGYAESPTPIATVGVGYDASPESQAALVVAKEIASEHRSLVKALEVVSIPTYAFTGVAPPALGDTVEVLLEEAKGRVDKLEDVEGRAIYGLPGEELAAFGEQVDLLVVGSRSYGPVKRLVLGSTSNFLQRHARCSLLVLPRTAASASQGEQEPEGQRASRREQGPQGAREPAVDAGAISQTAIASER